MFKSMVVLFGHTDGPYTLKHWTNCTTWTTKSVDKKQIVKLGGNVPTCHAPSQRGGIEPWMQRGVHSTQELGWTHCVYTERTCGTAGTSASEGRLQWNDCHPTKRDSVTADLYPAIQHIHQHWYLRQTVIFLRVQWFTFIVTVQKPSTKWPKDKN